MPPACPSTRAWTTASISTQPATTPPIFFGGRTAWIMESFYRHMRERHGVLMCGDGNPSGGQSNFDHDNREGWPGVPWEPTDPRPRHDHRTLSRTIEAAGVRSFGSPHAGGFA